MPEAVSAGRLIPSLLDRLFDDDDVAAGAPLGGYYRDVDHIRDAVARDLEALLNTLRVLPNTSLDEFPEAQRSLLAYGLPDFMGRGLSSPDDRQYIRRSLEDAIRSGDRRLRQVKVSIEPPRANERALRFRIDAVLHVDPLREPVSFDAMLQLNNKGYRVKGGN